VKLLLPKPHQLHRFRGQLLKQNKENRILYEFEANQDTNNVLTQDLPIKVLDSNFINHHIDMCGIILIWSDYKQLQYISNLLIPHHLQKLKQTREEKSS
jgi:hypothetical protein